MSNTKVKKVNSSSSPAGDMGQKYLSAGKNLAMRLWENEQPAEPKPEAAREYETVGYVIEGKAELHLEGQVVKLEPGDSRIVPQGISHTYKITEAFTAIEATSPPARVDGKDDSSS
jgi:quercetin dioxygenase-like cupin family protein